MSKRKNAAPVLAHRERQTETAALNETTISHDDYIKASEHGQGLIESLLLQGEENTISSSDLVNLTGVKSTRELQLIISQEREAGALILSTCRGGGGYFLPSDGEVGKREIAAFVATLRARALNTLKALKTAREALESLEGQVVLDDLEGV